MTFAMKTISVLEDDWLFMSSPDNCHATQF